MEYSWSDLNKTRTKYMNQVSQKVDALTLEYDQLINELIKEKKEKIKEIKEEIEEDVNSKNYDLNVNPYSLYYYLGVELGKRILVRKKANANPSLIDYYQKLFGSLNNRDEFIFEFTLTDNREGTYNYIFKENDVIIRVFQGDIENLFDIIKVIEPFEKDVKKEIPFKIKSSTDEE